VELWRQLLLNGSVKLFWRNEILDRFISDISREGFDIYTLECSEWDINNYHNDLASTLDFPDYYGKNLDAFNDCLSDMVPKEIGIVLVFKNYDSFAQRDPRAAYHILDIVQINSWRFLVEDIKLLAFVQSNDPTIDFPNLGGMSAEWNNEEWLNKNRGL
jgi:RNAse (barnase) inhibitor barstar